MNKWDVIIVGGGVIGAATFHFLQLKEPSLKVLLLEGRESFGRGTTGTTRGSFIRVFSMAPGVAEKALETVPYFLDFKQKVGLPCSFVQTGALFFFQEINKEKIVSKFDDIRRRSTTGLILLDAKEGRSKFPEFQWMDVDFAVFEPQAGYACSSSTTSAWISKAAQKDYIARTQIPVSRILVDCGLSSNQVTGVETRDGEVLHASQVLISSGPWTGTLLDGLGIGIRAVPSAIQVNRFHVRNMKASIPFFIEYETMTFARPGEDGIILGGFLVNNGSKEDAFRQPLSLVEASEARKRLSKRLKTLRTSQLVGGIRALEMFTDDAMPVLGFDSRYENLYLATGWCCSGFVLSPFYGEFIANELLQRL